MALLFMEGFEVDGGNANALSRKYDEATNATNTDTGRLHGTALQLSSNTRLRTRTLGSPTGTVVIGFGYKDGTVGASAEDLKISILSGVEEQLRLQFVSVTTTTFRIDIYRGATLVASSSNFSTLNWHYFEFKATIDPTSGTYELRRNESADISDTGVNTANTGSANWDTIDILNDGLDAGVRLDDIYVLDGTGSANNDFLGDSVIEGRLPTGDGSTTDWTPSSGANHWDLLDDTTDSTNVSASNSGDIDYLTFDALSFITGTIHGVMSMMTVGLDVLGTRTVRLKALSNASTTNGASQTVETTGYVTFYEVFEQDPDTSSAWSISGLNAAEFGFELVS